MGVSCFLIYDSDGEEKYSPPAPPDPPLIGTEYRTTQREHLLLLLFILVFIARFFCFVAIGALTGVPCRTENRQLGGQHH